jgi:hypothetical protein
VKPENKLPIFLILIGFLAIGAGRCEEAKEHNLCEDLSEKLCAKWFDCWPVISTELWDDVEYCQDVVRANCSNSEELHECDIDQADLEDCNDGIEGSACGELPDSCFEFVDCGEQ